MIDNRIKIASPERVLRIIKRMCEANLPLIIRGENDLSVGVKGRAVQITESQQGSFFRIDNVSERGMNHLKDSTKVQVEFVLSETQILFVSAVVSREAGVVVVKMPKSLVSVERRKNARHICTETMPVFVSLSVWQPSSDDLMTAPFYPQHTSLGGYLNVADLSVGGLCFLTRFPALGQVLKRGDVDHHARIYLPMVPPVEAQLVIRWVKRVKEYPKESRSEDFFDRFYRFGAEFVEPTEPLRFALRQYIQQLSREGAL
jgi:hypothetical protein